MTESTPRLEILPDDSVSIDDLTALRERGYSVLRSAHVGNLSPYNMTLAGAGIPILSVDHTVTGIDKNYRPELVVTQKESMAIAPLGKLACRARVSGLPAGIDAYGNKAPLFADQLHLDAVRGAITSADVFTNTEYMRRNEVIAGEIVSRVMTESPEIFERVVLANGSTEKRIGAVSLGRARQVLQLSDDPRAEREAILMPNALTILTNFIIESLESERSLQYHLSGPDMIRYVDRLRPEMEGLYARLKQTASFGRKLPDTLTVRLVPTVLARFATTSERAERLDALVETLLAAQTEFEAIDRRKRAFFGSGTPPEKDDKARFVADANAQRASVEAEVADKLVRVPEVLADPGGNGCITQYDVMSEGGLYVSPVNRTMSMRQLSALSDRLRKIGAKCLS